MTNTSDLSSDQTQTRIIFFALFDK